MEIVAGTRWSQGLRAFDEGLGLDANPYGDCGPAYREWRNGWYRASDEARAAKREREEAASISLTAIGVSPQIASRWQIELSAPHRSYHTNEHIQRMLGTYEAIGGADPTIMAAIWLHDIVYDAQRTDNEERSAEIARKDLVGTAAEIDRVVEIILDTKHHRGGKPYLDLFSDLDLAILGSSWRDYTSYMKGIRREYAHAPLDQYAARRAEVLRGFNDRVIFKTGTFERSEAAAHRNLEREIAILEDTPEMVES